MRARNWLLFGVLLLSLAACGYLGDHGCDDSYAPKDPSSCAYNSELVGLMEERNADVGEMSAPGEFGEGEAYLIVSPPVVSLGEFPSMSILNSSDVEVRTGQAFRLQLTSDGRYQDLTKRCPAQTEQWVLDPESESETQAIAPCKVGKLLPGSYRVTKDVTFHGEDGAREFSIEAYFKVRSE